MKNIVKYIKESTYPKYLICKAILCDKKLANYLLENYPADCLSQNLMNQLKKYIQTTSRSIDVFSLTFTNTQRMDYKELISGLLIDVQDNLFICMGSGDAIDEEEFCDYTGKSLSVFKKGYYISKSTINNEYKQELNEDDIKKATFEMINFENE